jgi:CheY-like chemotaxis protein
MATVLVVDDEFGIAELVEMALEDEGHRVVAAVNGRQWLERLAEAAPDLVLLDYMMPIMDGPGMLRAMRADPALRAVPVVLMTSLDEATARRECEGSAAFLRKPFRIELLLRTVAAVLGGARPGGAAGGR